MRAINEIIIHCSATPAGKDYTVSQIDGWHRRRGFREIGYHYVVYRDGSVHVGRHITMTGAHCKGHNAHSIGICYIGGLNKNGKLPEDTRTGEQKTALEKLLVKLHSSFPEATLHGHREYAAKECPSFDCHEYDYIFRK